MTLSGRHAASDLAHSVDAREDTEEPRSVADRSRCQDFVFFFFPILFFQSPLGSFVPKASRELSELEPVLPVLKTANSYYSSVTVPRTTIFK